MEKKKKKNPKQKYECKYIMNFIEKFKTKNMVMYVEFNFIKIKIIKKLRNVVFFFFFSNFSYAFGEYI